MIDVFISHHTHSSIHIVEGIVNKLESNGIKCWYAPRDTKGDYAGSIADAIEECKVFLLVLNKAASESPHVLNELNLVTERLSAGEEVDIIPFHTADTDISNKAKYYIGRMHWLDAMTPSIYDRIDELVEKVGLALNKEISLKVTQKKSLQDHKLLSKVPQVREIFYGRESQIEEIEETFRSGKRVIFLEGIGGIGKSEIAKQYATTHGDEYDDIVFITYVDGIKKLVCDPRAIEITNLEQGEMKEDEFFFQKLQVIRSVCNERTLFIIDNFDVNEDEDLELFIEGSHRVILTTRNSHSGYATIRVKPIDDIEVLLKIFQDNYGDSITEEDKEWLNKLFLFVENHTYMIELIAKQMAASFLDAEEMYMLIKKGTLKTDVSESIQGRKDNKTAYEHLNSLFTISGMSDEEKYILEILSIVGTKGVPAKRFKEWSEIGNMDVVNNLIRKSWVRREAAQRLSLHPLMAEVVRDSMVPNIASLERFLHNIANFAHHAWFRVYNENLEVVDNLYSVLSYFSPFDAEGVHYFEPMISFLWQVGRFDDSISFDHELYDSCIGKYGEASMVTGFVAKSLAGCYFNSRRERESVRWYEQGLKCMIMADEGDNEDLAMSYSKVARCYTWEFNFNSEKAIEYFNTSLRIRNKLREMFVENGETLPDWFNKFRPYTVEIAETRINETLLEMGRMYQKFGDYNTALKYAEEYKESMTKYSEKYKSNYAYGLLDLGVCKYHIGLKEQDREKAEMFFKESEESLKEALDINLKMRGELANDTIDNQEYLADLYVAMKRYGEAANAYMAVVSMLEKLYDPECERIQKVKSKMNYR